MIRKLSSGRFRLASSVSGARRKQSEQSAEIAGVKLSHPNRILYSEQGITKRELAEYYVQVADWILPHVQGRPLTLVRCPRGLQAQCFYQRNAEDGIPQTIRRFPLRAGKSVKPAMVIDSLAGLIALVQMGVLEIHTWGSTVKRIERPDRITFDLDPAPELPWKIVRRATGNLRDLLSDLDLDAFVKTTGGKGLHVVVPIKPTLDWEQAKAFAKAVAQSMAAAAPDLYVATMSKSKRAGRIFIDYLRNARSATAICAYSTRAHAGAPVAAPLRWDELKSDVRHEYFTIRNLPARLRSLRKDPWHDYESARRPITASVRKRLRVA
jgi:bifunctional non-homologous end joining protein LigD